MTSQAIAAPRRPWWEALLDRVVAVGEASEIGKRAELARRLYALSDEELAAVGLTRDRVAHHAFAPYMYL